MFYNCLDILLCLPRRLKQDIAVCTLVASRFVSFFITFCLFKGYKNASNISS